MRKIFVTASLILALLPAFAAAEEKPGADDKCVMLMAQVENRLEENPPQDRESVDTARQRLEAARQAQERDDAEGCMENAKAAFKALNKT